MRSTSLLLLMIGTTVVSAHAAAAGDSECQRCADARTLQEAGKCSQALSLLKAEIKERADSVEALGLQVVCYTAVGKRKDATKTLVSFLRNNPASDDVLWVKAQIAESAIVETPGVRLHFEHSAEVAPPTLLLFQRPIPSEEARMVQAGGDVRIDGVLRTDGTFGELEEHRSGDWSRQAAFRFGETAIEAMNGWRFFPALKNGEPTPVRFVAIVRYAP